MIKRYLTINSTDRKKGSTSDFELNVRDGVEFESCELIMTQIPNTYYNITDNNNKIIINGVTKSFPVGNYNLDEFFSVFSTNLDTLITAISFNDVTGILNFTLSSSVSVSFPSEGSLNFIIGFPSNYNVTSNSHNSSFPPSLAKHILFINVDRFSSNHSSSFQYSTSFTFSVPNNVNKNDIISYNQKTNFKQAINCRISNEVIYNLNITVRDQYNQIVQSLGEWTCLLSFF